MLAQQGAAGAESDNDVARALSMSHVGGLSRGRQTVNPASGH